MVERTGEQDRIDLLRGKMDRYREGRLTKEERDEVYDQIISLAAIEIIDRKGEEASGICFQIASGMDSLGIANQRFTAKVSGDIVGKIAGIAYHLKYPQ